MTSFFLPVRRSLRTPRNFCTSTCFRSSACASLLDSLLVLGSKSTFISNCLGSVAIWVFTFFRTLSFRNCRRILRFGICAARSWSAVCPMAGSRGGRVELVSIEVPLQDSEEVLCTSICVGLRAVGFGRDYDLAVASTNTEPWFPLCIVKVLNHPLFSLREI